MVTLLVIINIYYSWNITINIKNIFSWESRHCGSDTVHNFRPCLYSSGAFQVLLLLLINKILYWNHIRLQIWYHIKRTNLVLNFSCIQKGFNALKDIQGCVATVNLNLLTQQNQYIFYLLLHRFFFSRPLRQSDKYYK